MSRPNKREAIVDKARSLFYTRGIRAVGVDTIVAESGVAKMTLYAHFKSKDELIVACLDSVDERYRRWLRREVAAGADDPAGQILGIFDALQEWFETPNFRGCAFVNATIELADPDHPARAAVVNHKQRTREWITELAVEARLHDPDAVGSQILLLMEGAIITALVDRDASAAGRAKSVAEHLVAAHTPAAATDFEAVAAP